MPASFPKVTVFYKEEPSIITPAIPIELNTNIAAAIKILIILSISITPYV
jgi:hypothetical protein